jgi:hypothetical protein
MIIWRGFGILVPVAIFPGYLISMLITGAYDVAVTFWGGAVCCYLIGLLVKQFRKKRADRVSKDEFFFLGFTVWSVLFVIFGFVNYFELIGTPQ